jgi:hypothetical protein
MSLVNRPRRGFIAVGAMLIVAAPASGQTDSRNSTGHFLTSPSVAIDAVRRRCVELGDDTYTKDVPQVGVCVPHGILSRGTAAGLRWYSAVFGRRWLLTDSGTGARADTAAESEFVLFTSGTQRAGRDTLLTPVWHVRFEPEILRSVTPEIVSVNGGGALVGIDECVNGTGGCAQSFLLWRNDRWRLVHLAFVDSLNRRFPGAINHGFHVNVKTLRANAAVYAPSDANCCPSRTAEMQLRLREDGLEIVSLRLRP